MKILLVAPYFFESHRWMISAYKTALNLSKNHHVIVLTAGKPKYEKINKQLKVYRLNDWFLPDPINYSIILDLFKGFFELIKKFKPDVILVNKYMFYSSLVVIAARLNFVKIPIIVATDTFPGLNWHPRSWLVDGVMKVYNFLIGIPILKLADRVILFHSGNVAIAKKLRLNFEIIPNGVDLEAIRKVQPPADFEKRKGEIWIGYVGRLESIKGWYDLAEVALGLVKKYPQVRFIFVGDKKGKEKLIQPFKHSRIKFLGHRKDALGIYKKLDIFVLPSYSEGLSNALMEAMASGCACLSSQVGGVADLIQPRYNGMVFEAGNLDQLTRKLERLISDTTLRQRLQKNAPKIIREKFNWDKIAQKYQRLCVELRE